jgi:hypothetical protein
LRAFGHDGHVGSSLVVDPAARADGVNGDGVSGLSEQDAKVLHAQPLLFDANQRLDVAGLRYRICRVLLDLGLDQLCLVRVMAKGVIAVTL